MPPDTAGVPPALADKILADWESKNPPPVIYLENWPYFELFLALSTQWQTHGFSGQRIGISYPSIEALLRMRGVKRKKHATYLKKIQTIERAALDAWQEAAAKEK